MERFTVKYVAKINVTVRPIGEGEIINEGQKRIPSMR